MPHPVYLQILKMCMLQCTKDGSLKSIQQHSINIVCQGLHVLPLYSYVCKSLVCPLTADVLSGRNSDWRSVCDLRVQSLVVNDLTVDQMVPNCP